MDCILQDGSSPAVSEESADSELWSSDAAFLPAGGVGVGIDDDVDDDAESCNCDGPGVTPRGHDEVDEESVGEEECTSAPMSWRAWLIQNADGCGYGEEEIGQGEEEEVGSEKPAAGMEDRLFWETCLASGYP